MRVVTNTNWTGPSGGVELNVFQISQELAARGHEIDLLYVEPGTFLPRYHAFCRHVTQVPRVDFGYPRGIRSRLRETARVTPAAVAAARSRPDVIYANRIYSSGWSIPASRLTGAPVVCHLHGHDVQPRARIDRLNRRVSRFVAVSGFVADGWIANGIDPAKIEVVHNGVDPAAYPVATLAQRADARAALGLPDDVLVVLYFGRLDHEKGVEVLLRAWAALDLPAETARLLVVGSPMLDGDTTYTDSLHALATPSVTFLPNRPDVVTPLHAADVAVVPSVWDEPFGRTVIEGMATGIPVLGSRVGGIPEILGPIDRLLFDRGDADQLAAKLAVTLRWRDEEPGLGRACAARVATEFSLAATVDRLEAVFDDVSTARRRA